MAANTDELANRSLPALGDAGFRVQYSFVALGFGISDVRELGENGHWRTSRSLHDLKVPENLK